MLHDLRVLDLTNYLPGPYATQILADFGAEVIKVESPLGDPVRHLPPQDLETGLSAAFRALNQGKQSVVIDLKREEGRELLLRLVETADVLMEGFRPGVLDRLGVGAEVCRARNPRLVFCSISGYGQGGPYRDKAGHDLNYLAYSGALSIGTDAEGLPTTPGIQSADVLGSFTALTGVLMALHERARTGEGRVVDASMFEAALSIQAMHFMNHWAGLAAKPRAMTLNGGLPCYGTYGTSDGRAVALGALEPKFWSAFCDVVGEEDWVARQFDPDLREEVAALFRTRTRDEWRLILESGECCLAPVLDYDEVLDDPHVQDRGLLERGRRPAPPFRFQPPAKRSLEHLATTPGADTRDVLERVLGLTQEEVGALRESGVVVAPE